MNGQIQTAPEGTLFEVIIKYNGDIEQVASELNAEVEPLYQGYAILSLEESKIPQLYDYTQIEHVELPKILSFETSPSLITTCIQPVQTNPLWNLNGRNVIVAIIDSGIDYLHSDFRNEDGTSRILYIWDQTATGTPPQGFKSGAEYNNDQINRALKNETPLSIVPHVDTNGHGTAVAGVAVGNGRDSNGENIGVAPGADIISVKLGSRGYQSFVKTTELMRAIKYVISQAKSLLKPVAINISFGTNDGSHDGNSLFENYMNDISADWKTVIAIPTGNEGSAGHHYEGSINSQETKDIEFFTAAGITRFFVTMWKDFVDNLSVELIFPSGKTSGVVNLENQIKTTRENNTVARIVFGQPSHYTVSQQIYFDVTGIEGAIESGVWKIRIRSGDIVNGKFELWLPSLEAVTNQTSFATPSISNTLTIPSTARKVIAVAGYNDRLDSVVDFSGRGPANGRIQKPDLAAPATGILTTKSGGGYDTFTGTSFAAPFVTGAAALMMQWGIVDQNDPFLYGERIKAFLRLGANRSKARQYPNLSWGYGTLCLENTMDYLKKYKFGGGKEFWQQIQT
jgi:subtilisin family serine protease